MASRLFFAAKPEGNDIYEEKLIDFIYHPGFAATQKQKSILSLHESINKKYPDLKVLEISSKSQNPVGVKLSAFNLHMNDLQGNRYPLECIFQSSKVFEHGGPFIELLNVSPKEAKRDERLKSSGPLVSFLWDNQPWPLEPKTWFYDWLYVNAVYQNKGLSEQMINYNAFTDIEFNHKKSINCQARAAAIFVGLTLTGQLETALQNRDIFRELSYKKPTADQQLAMLLD